MNNVRLCLGISAVVALIGLIIGLVLYFKDVPAYAFIVTVGSGLLLFIVVIIATIIFRCLVTRPRLLQYPQRPSTSYPGPGKVLHDPPPPYKKSWGKEFERTQSTSDAGRRQSSCVFSNSVDLIRHLEGSNTSRTSLDKLTQLEIQRQGVSANRVSPVSDRPSDDALPAYDVAIQQLNAIDLLNVYIGRLHDQMEERVMATSSSDLKNICSEKVTPSTSLQVVSEMNPESCNYHQNVSTDGDLAPVHLPGKTVVSVVACFETDVHSEGESVAINIES